MLKPNLIVATLFCLACAQDPQAPAPAPAPGPGPTDAQAANQSLCATLIAQTNTIEIGGFPPDQLMAIAHGTPAADLSVLAGKSSDRNQHFEACVNYALAAASYIAMGGKDARSNTSTSMQMAVIEQKLGDGKKLSFLDKMLKGTFRMASSLGSIAPSRNGTAQPAYGGQPQQQQPAAMGTQATAMGTQATAMGTQAAPAAPQGPAPPCDKPPCEL